MRGFAPLLTRVLRALPGCQAQPMMGRMRTARRLRGSALVVAPGIITIYLGFNAGGFFPLEPAVAAVALVVVLALQILLAEEPFAGLGRLGVIVIAAMTLLSVWTLVSAAWSHAAGRSLIEFDRALLYLFTLLSLASLARTAGGVRWLVRSLAVGACVVSGIALVTRVLPRVWPVRPTLHPERLSYPLTYWNTLGLLAALGFVLCFYLTTSEREPRAVRVLGAAALPALASTALFTYSRGAIAVAALALIVYVVLARPRALPAGALAVIAPTAVAVRVTYGADLLSSTHPATAPAVAQGHHVALALGLSVVASAGLRLLLLRLDTALVAARVPRPSRVSIAAAWTAALVTVVALTLALDVPSSIGKQYTRFVRGGNEINQKAHVRERLNDPSNDGRLALWRVAMDGYRSAPLHGSGAGTYEILWDAHRPYANDVTEGHSLYVETLGELGVVGLALLVVTLLGILVGLARRIRGPDRALYAVLFAAALAWAVRASFDWDWEMPAVSVWFFVFGAAALTRVGSRHRHRSLRVRPIGRAAAAIGLLVVAVTPVRVAVSQAHLDAATRAFDRGDCPATINAALSSNAAVASRPDPLELIAYCDVRLGRSALALTAIRGAVARDPQSWQLRYGMALVQASNGGDPRPDLRRARRLNPLEPLMHDALKNFRTGDRSRWPSLALESPIPVQ